MLAHWDHYCADGGRDNNDNDDDNDKDEADDDNNDEAHDDDNDDNDRDEADDDDNDDNDKGEADDDDNDEGDDNDNDDTDNDKGEADDDDNRADNDDCSAKEVKTSQGKQCSDFLRQEEVFYSTFMILWGQICPLLRDPCTLNTPNSLPTDVVHCGRQFGPLALGQQTPLHLNPEARKA